MSYLKLILKEMIYRKVNSLIILLLVIISTAVSISVFSLSKASENETRKIMREQGLNLFIVPKGTDTLDLFTFDNKLTFSDKYIDILAKSKIFDTARHLTGILNLKYPNWRDPKGSVHRIVLTGYKDEAEQIYLSKQKTMGNNVKKGKVRIGFDISKNIPEGWPFIIKGKDGKLHKFTISKRMQEGHGIKDKSVAFNLKDLQELMGFEGKINKIEALGCVCHDGRLLNARVQVTNILPGVEVKELSGIANVREYQRRMMNRYASFIIPFIIIGCMIMAGFLFYINVKNRKYEIGILKAIGKNNTEIMALILCKAFMLGLSGAITGFFLGSLIAGYFGKSIFKFTGKNISIFWHLLWISLAVSPVYLIISSWIPALVSINIDPAEILKGE